MNIYKLACEKRDMEQKAKIVRNNGFVPAVLFGRHIDSLSIQINQNLAKKFLQTHSVGSRVILEIEGEEQLALLKDSQKDPVSGKLLHIDFHALTSGEAVKVTLPILYLNKDTVDKESYVQEQISEIEISTLPKFLMESVSVDLSKYSLGDSVFVSDLDVSNNENFEVLTPADSLVFTITHAARFIDEPEDEEESVEMVAPVETIED